MIRDLIDRVHDWAGEQIVRRLVADVHPQELDDEAELRDFIARDAAHKRLEDV